MNAKRFLQKEYANKENVETRQFLDWLNGPMHVTLQNIMDKFAEEKVNDIERSSDKCNIQNVISRFSWIYFDDEDPHEGYIAITDGKDIEFCKCWLGVDGELNYNTKQLTEYLAWFDANE